MSVALRFPSNAIHNIRSQFCWQSFAWMQPEIEKLRKHWLLFLCLVPVILAAQILFDLDYEGHDITASGIKIFTWLPRVLGRKPRSFEARHGQTDDIFPQGLASIDPLCPRQRELMDCKFLAGISSLSRTEKGKRLVYNMIKPNADGSSTVTFPGCPSEPIQVARLSNEEKHYYSTTDGVPGKFAGQWLPILEKAYGTYRVNHQDWWKTTLRFVKHAILDFRFTARPALLGFGASYGAADEIGAQVLNGGYTKNIETTSFELGSFGLGKGYVTLGQLHSWVDRPGAERKIQDEQDRALLEAMGNGRIVVASTEISGDAERYHLFSGHAYAVLDYDAKSRTLTLKDPICSDMWDPRTGCARDGVEDGLFKISLPEFNVLFSRLRVQMGEPIN